MLDFDHPEQYNKILIDPQHEIRSGGGGRVKLKLLLLFRTLLNLYDKKGRPIDIVT